MSYPGCVRGSPLLPISVLGFLGRCEGMRSKQCLSISVRGLREQNGGGAVSGHVNVRDGPRPAASVNDCFATLRGR